MQLYIPKKQIKYAVQEAAFHTDSFKNCKAKSIVSSGCSTDILGGQTTPTGPALPSSSPHANRAGLQDTSYIHCFQLLQRVPAAENQAEMLQMLAKAWSQRKYSLRCLQETLRKVGNALEVAQLTQNSLSSRVRQGLFRVQSLPSNPEIPE